MLGMRERCSCSAGEGGEEGHENLCGVRGGAAARLFFWLDVERRGRFAPQVQALRRCTEEGHENVRGVREGAAARVFFRLDVGRRDRTAPQVQAMHRRREAAAGEMEMC